MCSARKTPCIGIAICPYGAAAVCSIEAKQQLLPANPAREHFRPTTEIVGFEATPESDATHPPPGRMPGVLPSQHPPAIRAARGTASCPSIPVAARRSAASLRALQSGYQLVGITLVSNGTASTGSTSALIDRAKVIDKNPRILGNAIKTVPPGL